MDVLQPSENAVDDLTWSTTGQMNEMQIIDGPSALITVALSLDQGQRFLTCDESGSFHIWNAVTGLLQSRTCAHSGRSILTAVLCEGSLIAIGSTDRTISIWNTDTCESIMQLRGHEGSVNALVYKFGHLVSGSSDNILFDGTFKLERL